MITYNYGNDGKTGWNYLLTSYDADSDGVVDTNEKISYDVIGNPLTYRGATLAWYGRQLRSFTKNGITSTMTYDADGLRSSKTVAGVKTEYQYVGDKLFYEKRGDGNSFYYFYDSYGKLSAIYHHKNGVKTAYHVVTNAQGDVIALYSWTGAKVAEYSYDAWGNCTIVSDTSSTHIATLNPFRYRSYYRDTDLGLYYLQSRYYDSEIGRFINADSQLNTDNVLGFNVYSYCENNPIMYSDASGHSLIGALVGIGAVIGSLTTGQLIALGFVALVGLQLIYTTTKIAVDTVVKQVEKKISEDNFEDQSVYIMRNKYTNVVEYVGRTNNPDRRQGEHDKDVTKSDLLPMEVKFTGLTKKQARAMEQTIIASYGLSKLINRRNEISPNNVSNFATEAGHIAKLIGTVLESEVLCIMEG